MDFSEEEIKTLGLQQLSASEIADARRALNGFAGLFSKQWVLDFFNGAQSAQFVRHLISCWNDWEEVSLLKGAETFLKRWKEGFREEGVESELLIIAAFVRAGAEVELFPPVGSRAADCRVRLSSNEPWTYVEISQRQQSEILKNLHLVLVQTSEAASKCLPNMHGKVAILRSPSDEENKELIAWINEIKSPAETRFKDLAVFYAHAIGSKDDTLARIDELLTLPHLFSTSFSVGGGANRKGTSSVVINDDAAKEVLEAEAAQLPKNEANIIVLDISSVIGGVETWEPLIKRRLQPVVNTRIGAVMLSQRFMGGMPRIEKGCIIANQHAKKPVDERLLQILSNLMNKAN